jgi:hypothetical protein
MVARSHLMIDWWWFLPVSVRGCRALREASFSFHDFISLPGTAMHGRVVIIRHKKMRSPAFGAAGVIMVDASFEGPTVALAK